MSATAVIVGAGVGGLAAALDLAASGVPVTVLERARGPGGRMREVEAGGRALDAGPTVLTLRRVFDDLFANAGDRLEDHVALDPLAVLARHAWSDGAMLDLDVDPVRTADAIGALAGAEDARAWRAFAAETAAWWRALEGAFLDRSPAGAALALGRAALSRPTTFARMPFLATLSGDLARRFRDRRLVQLFGRYATYVGSSPHAAPAALAVIAHVEASGVWCVRGGMQRLGEALARAAARAGARIAYDAEVAEVRIERGRATGVSLADGSWVPADAVIVNADAAALAAGRLGAAAARAVPPLPRARRSLSAITIAVLARTSGFTPAFHNVCFADDPAGEFDDAFARGSLPRAPTVYACAQDRPPASAAPTGAPERLFLVVNAPARGDRWAIEPAEIERCRNATFDQLRRCGLDLALASEPVVTTPADFERAFPGAGGALYGAATHGPWAALARPGPRTRIAGLHLAGGSAHPGAGLPMVATSGRRAAAAVRRDLGSISRSRRAATRGGTSTS